MNPLTDEIWHVRAQVYAHFAEQGVAPSAAQVGERLGIGAEAAAAHLRALHDRHALYLDADGAVRMANPFSGIKTPFRVRASGLDYYANCAWDSLGIPAALHADADVEIDDPLGGPVHRLTVRGAALHGEGIVHFLIPFARWYDDLVET